MVLAPSEAAARGKVNSLRAMVKRGNMEQEQAKRDNSRDNSRDK